MWRNAKKGSGGAPTPSSNTPTGNSASRMGYLDGVSSFQVNNVSGMGSLPMMPGMLPSIQSNVAQQPSTNLLPIVSGNNNQSPATPSLPISSTSKKTSSSTSTSKKKKQKSDNSSNSASGTGTSGFFATSFIPIHSASLLKGITPIMPGPKNPMMGMISMSSSIPQASNSMPPFPSSKPKEFNSDDDVPSYSSNSSDQSDSDSSDDSASSDASYSSSSSDSEKKKKKKKKTKKTALPVAGEPQEKKKKQTKKKKEVVVLKLPEKVEEKTEVKKVDKRRKKKEVTEEPAATGKRKKATKKESKDAKETKESPVKKKRKTRVKTAEASKVIPQVKDEVTQKAITESKPSNIYATEDDERLFIMDRNDSVTLGMAKAKKLENEPTFSKNYEHDRTRIEMFGLPWCFVKESDLNGSERSNTIPTTTYLDSVVQENQYLFSDIISDDGETGRSKEDSEKIYEPALIEDMSCLLPVDLIRNPEIFNTIFSMNTWNNILKEEHRLYLKQFLPPILTSKDSSSPVIEEQFTEVPTEEKPAEPEVVHHPKEVNREEEENQWKDLMNGTSGRYKRTKPTTSELSCTVQGTPATTYATNTDSPLLTKTLQQLFSHTPMFFNQPNDNTKLVRGIQRGVYHPSVQLEKQQMKFLMSINLRMEYHLYVECELMAKRRLSAHVKMKALKLPELPQCLRQPSKQTLLAIEKRKHEELERNNRIPLPVATLLDQQGGSMEPPKQSTTTTSQAPKEENKTLTSPPKIRKKPGPKKKKKDPVPTTTENKDESMMFEFVTFSNPQTK